MKEATGQEPHKSIKETLIEIIRNYIKKKITGNLGDVCETEDKLICYVRKEKCRIEKSHSGYKIYHMYCIDYSQKYKELVEKYDLDKQVVYVLDGLTFSRDEIVEIKGNKDCEIQIEDCKFEFKVSIVTSGNCTLRNIIIEPKARPVFYVVAENLIMNNTIIQTPDAFDVFAYDGVLIRLKAKNSIELKDFKVGEEISRETELEVVSNFIDIYNSTLSGKNVSIKVEKLHTKDSLVTATNSTSLNVEEFNELNINSPAIEYNDKLLQYKGTSICLKPINKDLDINRQALLSQLRSIKANLAEYKENIVEQVVRNIDKEPVSKMLARTRSKQEGAKKITSN